MPDGNVDGGGDGDDSDSRMVMVMMSIKRFFLYSTTNNLQTEKL